MAWQLYRLGRTAFRHPWRFVAGWLALLVVVLTGAATLSGETSDSFTIPGVESLQAFDLIKERSPQAAPDGATAQIVYQAPEGQTLSDPDVKQAVTASLAEVQSEDVASIVSPYQGGTISADGSTGYATVSYTVQGIELSEADKSALEGSVEPAEDAGLTAVIGGDALQEIPGTGATELIGVVLALVVLVITFSSLLAAGMPLLTALIGVGIGVGGITAATGFMDLGSTTTILALMLGLAVGIDYALFITSRYRHEVRAGRSPEEAAGHAVGTAGSAVVFAGLTVIIALAGLSVVGIGFLTEMGVAAAVTVAVAVLIALTLLPALFGFAKARITQPRIKGIKAPDPQEDGHRTVGRRWADFVTRHRVPTVLAGLAVAGVLAVPVTQMELSLPDNGTQPEGTGAREAFDLISDNFGAGANGPLLVVVDTQDATDPQAAVRGVTQAVQGVQDDVVQVVPADPAAIEATGLAQITVVPESGPSDAETQDLVSTLRDAVAAPAESAGADVYVSGQTAVYVDVSEKLFDALPVYLLLVVGLAFVLLVAVFRSLLVPLKAVVGFLLSIGISLGTTVAVFQWGWLQGLIGLDTTAPIISFLPILLVGILFGLSMDYELFLVSRMREEHVHGAPARKAVVHGFQYGARVVTAAAIIMIGVFGSFALSDDATTKSIGFGLAAGVIADAFLVRMTLVPAVMALLGEKAWWLPRWLDRAIPNFDVEGETLQRRLRDERGHDDTPGTGDGDRTLEPSSAR